jgi:hypothetical protein
MKARLHQDTFREGDCFATGFSDGKRQVLEQALQLPLETNWAEEFELKKLDSLFWYFRAPRGAHGARIELLHGDDIDTMQQDPADPSYKWGTLSGRVAAVRWLSCTDHRLANLCWPDLDS